MRKIDKILITLGVGYASYSAWNYFTSISDEVVPLKNFSQELDPFDKKPRDAFLSVLESEDFLKQDKNLSPEKIGEVKNLIDSLKAVRHINTQESAKNLQRGLEFVLIRERLTKQDITQEELNSKQERDRELDYSDFYRYAFSGEKSLIKKVILKNKSDRLTAVFLDNSTNSVKIPQNDKTLKELADKLAEKSIQVEIKSQDSSIVDQLLFYTVFLGLPAFIIYSMLSGGSGGGLKKILGISSVNALKEKGSKVTFNDVAGIDEAKEELKEVVDFLKDHKKYDSIGAKIPKGVLLVGPPGNGKTLLAKAVAGEAKVPFFSLSGSDFVEMFVGVGAARVRDLFKQARKHAPCLVFIDELDAVGRQRGAGLGGGHDEREQTLNQLLVDLDGFDAREGIVVIAATNRPDILDTALLRPGRFDRQIVVDRPDVKGREAILKIHAKGKPLADDADLRIIAQRTPGFTGADLANLLNEAALLAGRKAKSIISMTELEEAIDKVIAGPEKKSRIISPEDKKLTSYHESGHALVAHFEPNSKNKLHKVTIIPRGMALGLTMTLPEEDQLLYTKAQLLSEIKVMLGGRVAEEIIYGEDNVTTGAQNDLERVRKLLKKMITQFGMSKDLGLLAFGESSENVFLGRDFGNTKDYSEETASKIDMEMKKIVDSLHKEVKDLLSAKRKHLDALTQVLLEKETLDKKDFADIISQVDKGAFKFSVSG